MSTTVGTSLPGVSPIAPEGSAAADRRIVSIDIFRGITMAVMIFVNELASVRGMPWWTEHAPGRLDYMTYVDMVFPFFLFAVGMSLPLSVAQRLKRDPSLPALWLHILTRYLALLILGLILANAEKADPARTGISGSTWALLGLLSAMLYLNVYPRSAPWRMPARILRLLGLAGVAILLAIFRSTTPAGHTAWLDFSYPEILGLIGITYFGVAVLYIPTRKQPWASTVWFVVLVALCAFSTAHWITFPSHVRLYVWPFGNGAMGCIVMAGVITSTAFLHGARRLGPRKTAAAALAGAVLALLAGRVLTPLGISKIRATPTWSLYSIGAAVLLFTLLYWVCDVRRWQRWSAPFRPAGANTLLTYLLPDLWYFALGAAGITFFDAHWNAGAPGVIKTVAFTLLMLALSAALTRAKLRLQL